MDVGKTIRRFVAEPLRDPFRRAPREPEPEPEPEERRELERVEVRRS